MADHECTERARIAALESGVQAIKVEQARMSVTMDGIAQRAEERHRTVLEEIGEVKTATGTMSKQLLDELRAQRDHQREIATTDAAAAAKRWEALRDPRVLGVGVLLIIALTVPQLLPSVISAATGGHIGQPTGGAELPTEAPATEPQLQPGEQP